MWNRIAHFSLVALELFLGATAIGGALLVVPAQPTELLIGSPFADYTIPALALGIIVGGGALLAATLVILNRRFAVLLSVAVGVAIIVFELVETAVVGLDVWLHAIGLGPAVAMAGFGDLAAIPAPLGVPLPLWLQPFYVVVGLLIILLALRRASMPGVDGHSVRFQSTSPLPVTRSLTIAYVVTCVVTALLVASSMAGLLFGQRGLYEQNLATLPAFLTQDV